MMSKPLGQLPFFERLENAQTVLLAGAGGGFDFFCGLPLYHALKAAGKTVYLANLSFSDIEGAQGKMLAPDVMEVTADTLGNELYFPELHFCRWMRGRGEEVSVFAFPKTGIVQLTHAYKAVCDHLQPDALVLVDGGTDSLMRGDETGLGTPVEDVSSILAAVVQNVPVKMLMCVGFGVDAFHGVCHAQYLEAVADLIAQGAYLGTWSLMREMPEVLFYQEASEFVFRKMPHHPSIVSSSILSALEGHFGDYHVTARTQSSKLFINPLMALVWCFELEAVAGRLLYPPELADTESVREVLFLIRRFRDSIFPKPFEPLPM
jgi:hypothetical protein